MKLIRSAQSWACLLTLLATAGCTTYYRVTLQSSEIVEISKESYRAGIK